MQPSRPRRRRPRVTAYAPSSKTRNSEPLRLDTERAKEADAPLVNYRRRRTPTWRAPGPVDEDDVKRAKDSSAKSVEVSVEIPTQHHVCLETHGHVIHPDGEGDRSVVYAFDLDGLPARRAARSTARLRQRSERQGSDEATPQGEGSLSPSSALAWRGCSAARIAGRRGVPCISCSRVRTSSPWGQSLGFETDARFSWGDESG